MILFSARFPLCWFLYYLYCSVCRVSALYMKTDLGTQRITGGHLLCPLVQRQEGRIIHMPFLTPCNGDCTISLVHLFQCLIPLEKKESSSQYLTYVCMQQFQSIISHYIHHEKAGYPSCLWSRLFCVGRLLLYLLQVSFRISNPSLFSLSL